MANRVIGIEFSPESIKLVEVGYGRRLKVYNFAMIDNRAIDSERRLDQLNHTLQVRGFEAKEAVVAVSGVQVEHRLLTLPPLSARELRFVMQREARKSAPAGVTETCWDYETLKSKEQLGITKRQILLVTAATDIISEALEFFGRSNVRIGKVTTVGGALLNLVKHIGYWKNDIAKIVVHFGIGSVHILFIQEGALLLCRDLPISSRDVEPEQQFERLMTEIKRSTLYFRQNFPQGQIDEVLFSGESQMIGPMVSRAKEELGIETNVLRFDDNLDPSAFKGDWDEFRFHMPSLAAAFGVAWHASTDQGVNLIPGKSGTKEGPPAYKKFTRVAAVLTIGVLLLFGFRYFTGSRQLTARHADIEASIAALEPVLSEGSAVEGERNLADARTAFMNRMASGIDWEETLRSLSLVVPETAVFETIQLESGDARALIVTGYLRGAQGQTNADFSRFFDALRGLEHFSSVEMSKPLNVTYEEGPAVEAGDPTITPAIRSRVTFEVRCILNSSL